MLLLLLLLLLLVVVASGQQCVDSFQAAAEAVWSLAEQGPGSPGYAKLDADFLTCSSMQSDKDLSILLSNLMGNVQVPTLYLAAVPTYIYVCVCVLLLSVLLVFCRGQFSITLRNPEVLTSRPSAASC